MEAVLQTPPITSAFGVPAALVGVFNFRGAIVPTVVVPSIESTNRRHAIVVRIPTFGRLAVLCDWVEDLQTEGGELPIAGFHVQDADLVHLCEEIVRESGQVQVRLPEAPSPKIRVILKDVNP